MTIYIVLILLGISSIIQGVLIYLLKEETIYLQKKLRDYYSLERDHEHLKTILDYGYFKGDYRLKTLEDLYEYLNIEHINEDKFVTKKK